MPFIRENLNSKIRDITLDGINSRGRFISSDEGERITNILGRLEHKVPLFAISFLSANVSSQEFNTIFDHIYVDHTIMMEDVMILYRSFNEIGELIKDKYVRPRFDLKETIASIKSFIRAKPFNQVYNMVDIHYMGKEVNQNKGKNALLLDKSTGTLRLDNAEEKIYSRESDIDISTELITEACHVYEESPVENLFDVDNIYYIAVTTKNPINRDDFADYDGVVAAIDIILPTVIPINVLRVRLVSDEKQHILGLSYSKTSSIADIGTTITDYRIVNNGFIHEINFDTVEARRIRVYIGSQLYEEARNKTTINGELKQNYLKDIEETLFEMQINEAAYNIIPTQSEIKEKLQKAVRHPDLEVKAGTYIYMIPIRNIEVAFRKYKTYGLYRSKGKKLEGNLAYITTDTEQVDAPGVKTVTKVNISGKDYSIGSLDESGEVSDVSIVEINDIENLDKMYKFDTNFIPNQDEPYTIEMSGRIIDKSEIDFGEAEKLPNGDRYYLPSSSLVSDGAILSLKYTPNTYDRSGVQYDPRFLDVVRSVGKPNVRNYLFANKVTNYLYFYDNIDNISIYHYDDVSINKNEELYVGPTVNGEDFDNISKEFTDVDNNSIFRIDKNYFGLYDGGYVLIEETLVVSNGNEIITSSPYMKGMIVIFQDGKPLVIQSEYSTTYGDPTDISKPFSKVYIDINAGYDPALNIDVTYMPLVASNETFPTTVRSNIERHNISEKVEYGQPTKEIVLGRYPFIDPDIAKSGRFGITRGVYYLKDRESVIYEPFIILRDRFKLEPDKDYKVQGRKIIFTEEVTGSISIDYYSMSDSLAYKVEMFRLDPTKFDSTPQVLSIFGLSKVIN